MNINTKLQLSFEKENLVQSILLSDMILPKKQNQSYEEEKQITQIIEKYQPQIQEMRDISSPLEDITNIEKSIKLAEKSSLQD